MKRVIYLIEDDNLQADYVARLLGDEFGSEVEVRIVHTESEFSERFDEIASAKPACVVVDILLQWAEARLSDDSVGPDSYLTAGLRCQERLDADPRTKGVPVMFYTVLDQADVPSLPRNIAYLRKDAPDSQFIKMIRRVISG